MKYITEGHKEFLNNKEIVKEFRTKMKDLEEGFRVKQHSVKKVRKIGGLSKLQVRNKILRSRNIIR